MKNKIELSTVEITPQNIRIASDEAATLFINLSNLDIIDLQTFKANVQALALICKNKNISFSRKGARVFEEQYHNYFLQVTQYRSLFERLGNLWRRIVDEGLYSPLVADPRLKVVQEIRWDAEKLLRRSTALSQCRDINYNLNKLHGELKTTTRNYTKICL